MLAHSSNKRSLAYEFGKTLLRNLKVRFCTDDSEYLGQLCISTLASAVDPRSKHLRFLSIDVAAEVRNRLQTEMTKVVNFEPEPVAANALDTTQTSTRMRLLASAFGKKRRRQLLFRTISAVKSNSFSVYQWPNMMRTHWNGGRKMNSSLLGWLL